MKGKLKTHCRNGHLLTPENILLHRRGEKTFRRCKTCTHLTARKYYVNHREEFIAYTSSRKSKKRAAKRAEKFNGMLCPKCGGTMGNVTRIDAVYCSKKCADTATHRVRTGRPKSDALQIKVCVRCSREFYPHRSDQQYCSYRCYMEKYDRRLVDELSDSYVAGTLQLPVAVCPDSIIKLKRTQLEIKRYLKQLNTTK